MSESVIVMCCTVLHCTVLHCTMLYYTILMLVFVHACTDADVATSQVRQINHVQVK